MNKAVKAQTRTQVRTVLPVEWTITYWLDFPITVKKLKLKPMPVATPELTGGERALLRDIQGLVAGRRRGKRSVLCA